MARDRASFEARLKEVVAEEVADLRALLHKDVAYGAFDAAFLEAMAQLVDSLTERTVQRAALFGQNRHADDGETKKRTRTMDVKESDFYFAWETLEQDSRM
jgi:hypothetical protein